jgi:SAM-dependent methyltransferase/GNAT superfamily N-acetyltransferase
MSFEVSADAYLRFMGQYSEPLAVQFADLAGVGPGQRVLDVGCGPGALTAELVRRTGAASVSAVEPSASFAAAVRERLPGVDIRQAPAERLPYPADTFDTALAQLVVHFMTDPVQGLREMARVTRPGGVVAACVWDHAGGRGPLTAFWSAARELDPDADNESGLAGVREGHLALLYAQAGLDQAQATSLSIHVRHAGFEQWWERFTLGVGPAGAYVAALTPQRRAELRERCRSLLPAGPVEVDATVWAVTCRLPAELAVTVRLADQSDVSALRRIATAAYQHYVARIGRAPAPMTADYDQAVRSGQTWVAVQDGQVTGFVVLIPQPGYLLLENLAVAPAAQGRGIGGRLLHRAEDHARGLGLTEIRLYTNEAMTENLAYYPRRGYVETHRAEQNGFRRVFFRKPLA